MAPRVHAPVKDYTGTVAGVSFVNGSGETESGPALAYFRRKGYRVEGAKAPEQPKQTEQPKQPEQPKVDQPKVEPVESGKPERPHPVQGNLAAWFEYLTAIDPDHGFKLEDVKRKELIEAANKIDGTEK